MTKRVHFRLQSDTNNDKALWTGAVTVSSSATNAEARRAVAKHMRVERLPANTLVLTCKQLESGKWTEEAIREHTSIQPKVKKFKSFADVPASFDDVQDMLKKLGLA